MVGLRWSWFPCSMSRLCLGLAIISRLAQTSTGGHDGEWRVAPAGAVAGSMAFAPQGAMTANAWQAPSGACSWKVPASVSLRAYRRGWPWSLISRSGCSGLLLASVRPFAAAPALPLLAFSRRGVLLRRQARWRRVWLSCDGGSAPGGRRPHDHSRPPRPFPSYGTGPAGVSRSGREMPCFCMARSPCALP